MATPAGNLPPVGQYFGRYFVDYKALYTQVVEAIETINRAPAFWFVSKFVERGDKLILRHFERSMEFALSPEYSTPGMQRLRFWTAPIPLYDYKAGFGFSYEAWQDLTLDEAQRTIQEAFRADERLQAKAAYAPMLSDGNTAHGTVHGVLTYSPFWNGTTSGLTPPPYKQNVFTSDHTHYNYRNASTITLADITAMLKDIQEHGVENISPSNSFLISSALGTQKIKDIMPIVNTQYYFTSPLPPAATVSVQGIPEGGLDLMGFKVLTDQMVATTDTAGNSNVQYYLAVSPIRPPVYRREPANPQAKGLQMIKSNVTDNPFCGAYFLRRMGHIVQEKGIGTVLYVNSGATAYVNPNYTFEEII